MFSTLYKTNFNFSITFLLSSFSAFNLDQSKILLFGTELSLSAADALIVVCLESTIGKHTIKTALPGSIHFSANTQHLRQKHNQSTESTVVGKFETSLEIMQLNFF